jgi:hypothetical protein
MNADGQHVCIIAPNIPSSFRSTGGNGGSGERRSSPRFSPMHTDPAVTVGRVTARTTGLPLTAAR